MPSNPTIFDRQLLRARRERARMQGPETFLIDRVAVELGERLSAVLRTFERAVDLGTPTDAVARALAGSDKIASLVAAAPYDAPLRVAADEEILPFAEASLDLVVSALALQFVNDLPGALIQVRRALKPDGLLLAALVGGDSLSELREAFAQAESEIEGGISPRVSPFADLRELGALLQRAGFALPVVDSDKLTVRYASVFDLMRDLRRMGATNVLNERHRTPLKRATLQRLAEIYARAFRRCRRPCARDLRDRLAVGLGAAREPAEAAASRLGEGAARRCARHQGNPDRREAGWLMRTLSWRS